MERPAAFETPMTPEDVLETANKLVVGNVDRVNRKKGQGTAGGGPRCCKV